MNPIIRNFWSIFRRFRLAMTLNVLGMAIAFAAFMVIMMQWHYDVTFDDATPHGDCIFRVESELTGLGSTPVVSRPYAESFIQSSAHIESGCLLYAMDIPLFLTVRDELSGQESYFNELCNPATPSLTRVFDFEMLEGSADALEVENQLLIPESLARKWFGNQSALGKRVETGDLQLFREDKAYIVGGVYRDFPQNSTLQNVVYASAGDFAKNDWGEVSYSFFVRLDDPSVASDLLDNFKVYAQRLDFNLEEYPFFFNYIRPLKDLHWVEGLNFDSVPKASRQTSYLLFTIAWVIIFIAAINFTNFSTALAPIRMRSINTQRVLGSTVGHLRWQLAAEAMLVSFLAFLLSILFLYVAKENGLERLVTTDLALSGHIDLLLATAIVSLVLGAAAGLYPAYYMTSFQPALVLKGSFGLSATGRRLRAVLMGFQYVASFALIIAALFMMLQNRYTHTASLGYDKELLLVTDLSPKAKQALSTLTNQLKGVAGVENVAYIDQLLSDGDDFRHNTRTFKGELINYDKLVASAGILDVLGIRPVEGRDFRKGDEQSKGGTMIFNQLAAKQYGIQVGDKIGEFEVVGIIPDIKYTSFRQAVSPMAFTTGELEHVDEDIYDYAYIRVAPGADLYAVRQQVQDILHGFDSSYAFNVRVINQVIDAAYQDEQSLTTLIALFSFLAVFISIVGVFGLVVFDSEYKRKEIGIRKVMGATTGEILVMFNKVYLRMMSVCFILAAPLAWYGVHRWLENFSYKTPMYWWVYLAALAVVGLITVATVTYQNWKAANANPVESLKTE